MDSVVHLVRRSVEQAHAQMSQTSAATYELPTWGVIMLASTTVFFIALMTMIEYTFGRLIPTLIMIESPQAILFEPLSMDDPDAPLEDEKIEQEMVIVKQQPITSSFRATIKHLVAKGGFFARFRGASAIIMYSIAVQYTGKMISLFNFIPNLAAPVLASVLCAQLAMAWTHIVISEPNAKAWFRRIPSMRQWKKVAIPTAVKSIAAELTVILPAWLALSYGLGDIDQEKLQKASLHCMPMMVVKGLSVFGLAAILGLLIFVPANVTLTRVQASLLPDNEETIVPFDRTFGGKVVPEMDGGSGVIATRDVWKTFDWNSRVRLIKAYAKVVAMEIFLSIAFFMTLACQVYFIMGDDLKKMIADASQASGEVTILPVNM